MDKKEFIEKALLTKDILNNIAFLEQESIEAAISIISEYCVDKGKDVNLIPSFISIVCRCGFIKQYYKTAFTYYITKFDLNCLYKEDKLISIYSNI